MPDPRVQELLEAAAQMRHGFERTSTVEQAVALADSSGDLGRGLRSP